MTDATTDIEITPEMIEAGLSAFYDYDSRFEEPRDAIPAIYIAMERAKAAHRPTLEIPG
jgi:hypothetical protein